MESRRKNLRELSFEKSPTNASLWLNKYIREQQKGESQESSSKQDLVNQVSKIEVSTIYEDFYQNMWVKELEKNEKRFIEISGRMIVGLGSESVLETSITLHRTFGVPYIPGSALKGLAANYAHRFMGEGWNKETKDKVNKETVVIGKAHRLMFGSQDSAGFVIFHDALYVPGSYKKKPRNPLEPDILTVHHQKYYEGKGNAPADWDSPVPIPLLSAQGQYLLVVSANSGDKEFNEKMAKLAIEILGLALEHEGIGAKTSSGYGRATLKPFQPIEINHSIGDVSEVLNDIEPLSPTTQNTPQLSDEELKAQQQAADERRFQSIQTDLVQIGSFDKLTKEKLKDIRKRIKKIEEPKLKKDGAKLFLEKVKQVSGKNENELEETYPWFKEIKLFG